MLNRKSKYAIRAFYRQLAWPGVASADTYVQTSDHCSTPAGNTQTGCGNIGADNTITVTQSRQA